MIYFAFFFFFSFMFFFPCPFSLSLSSNCLASPSLCCNCKRCCRLEIANCRRHLEMANLPPLTADHEAPLSSGDRKASSSSQFSVSWRSRSWHLEIETLFSKCSLEIELNRLLLHINQGLNRVNEELSQISNYVNKGFT